MGAQGGRVLEKFANRECFNQASRNLAEPVLPLAKQFFSQHCHQNEGFLGSVVAEKDVGRKKYLS